MVKSNLFVFTGLVFVLAVAFIAIGSAFLIQMRYYGHACRELHAYIPVFLMLTAGICSLLTSLVCLFTKLLRSERLLGITVVLLALAAVLSFNCSGFAAVYLAKAGRVVTSTLLADIRLYQSPYNDVDNELVAFQLKFSCCGVRAPADWALSPYFSGNHSNNASLPNSCFSSTGAPFQQGCNRPVTRWFWTRFGALLAVSAVAGLAMLVELLYLVNRMSRRSQSNYRLMVNAEDDN